MKSVDIKTLMRMLKLLQSKKIDKVQIKGTLIAEDYGNFVLVSTESQI